MKVRSGNAKEMLAALKGQTVGAKLVGRPRLWQKHISMSGQQCFYCDGRGTQEDHFPPQTWAKYLPKRERWLIRACGRCNTLLTNTLQETLQERVELCRALLEGRAVEVERLSENEIAREVMKASIKWV